MSKYGIINGVIVTGLLVFDHCVFLQEGEVVIFWSLGRYYEETGVDPTCFLDEELNSTSDPAPPLGDGNWSCK